MLIYIQTYWEHKFIGLLFTSEPISVESWGQIVVKQHAFSSDSGNWFWKQHFSFFSTNSLLIQLINQISISNFKSRLETWILTFVSQNVSQQSTRDSSNWVYNMLSAKPVTTDWINPYLQSLSQSEACKICSCWPLSARQTEQQQHTLLLIKHGLWAWLLHKWLKCLQLYHQHDLTFTSGLSKQLIHIYLSCLSHVFKCVCIWRWEIPTIRW